MQSLRHQYPPTPDGAAACESPVAIPGQAAVYPIELAAEREFQRQCRRPALDELARALRVWKEIDAWKKVVFAEAQ